VVRLEENAQKFHKVQLGDLVLAEEEGKRCYETSAVFEYYQLCFGCGDAEIVARKPVINSNNCFLEESLGSLVISGFEVDAKVICE